MSITTAKGYLAVRPHYHDDLSIWKINRSECTQISNLEGGRIFSMTTSPEGEILMVGDNLHIITLADDGTIHQHKSVENSNTINTVISLGAYRTLIVDNRFNSNRLKLLNYLKDTDEVLGDSHTPLGKIAYGHIVLVRDSIVLSLSQGQFCVQQFSNFNNTPKDIAEIRKNSRLLAQAFRTKTSFFGQLPKELNIKIAALTNNLNDEKIAEKISLDHFCKPTPF